MQTKQDNTPTQIPQVFKINGMNLIQVPSTQNSGLYKFKDSDGEIYLYERNELPASILKELTPLPTQVGNEVLHTQGEWRRKTGGAIYCHGDNHLPIKIANVIGSDAIANAEFICKAVNNYSKLVEENERLHKQLNAESDYQALQRDENYKLKESNRELLAALEIANEYVSQFKNRGAIGEIDTDLSKIETAINNAKNLNL